jgi:hypothetical protein
VGNKFSFTVAIFVPEIVAYSLSLFSFENVGHEKGNFTGANLEDGLLRSGGNFSTEGRNRLELVEHLQGLKD